MDMVYSKVQVPKGAKKSYMEITCLQTLKERLGHPSDIGVIVDFGETPHFQHQAFGRFQEIGMFQGMVTPTLCVPRGRKV